MAGDDFDPTASLIGDQRGWLGEYGDIETLIGKCVRAGIDAYMAGKGWHMPGSGTGPGSSATDYWKPEERFIGKGYSSSTLRTCTCPGPDGEGGGVETEVKYFNGSKSTKTSSHHGEFEGVKTTIHGHTDRFIGLPEPGRIEQVANIYRQGISGQLHPERGYIGEKVNSIAPFFDLKNGTLTGRSAMALKTKFLDKIHTVLYSYSDLAELVGYYMAAQAGMWAAARASAVGAIKTSTDRFNDVAATPKEDSKFSLEDVLKVAAVVASIVGIVIPESRKAASQVAKIGGVLVDAASAEAAGDVKSTGFVDSYESVITDVLKAGLDSVKNQVKDLEDQIYSGAGACMNSISDSNTSVRDNWQLPPPSPADLSDEPKISSDGDAVTKVVNVMSGGYSPSDGSSSGSQATDADSIALVLDSQLSQGRGQQDEIVGSVVRDPDIGHGHYGPGLPLQELNDMLCDLIKYLRDEVDDSARNFLAAYQYLTAANDQATATMQTTAAQLEALDPDSLNGYDDPWRYTTRPAPSERDREMRRDVMRF